MDVGLWVVGCGCGVHVCERESVCGCVGVWVCVEEGGGTGEGWLVTILDWSS